MNKSVAVPIVFLALSSGLAGAADAPTAPAEAPKMVCFEQPRTGSNIKRKTCMTEQQAEQRRKEDQAAAEGLKRGSSGRSKSYTENLGVGSR